MKHNIMPDGQPTGVQQALAAIRELQAAPPYTDTTFYIFSGGTWLCGSVFYNDVPPMWYEWYIGVPPVQKSAPIFVYGADSCQHIDAGEYIKFIKHLIDTGALRWLDES